MNIFKELAEHGKELAKSVAQLEKVIIRFPVSRNMPTNQQAALEASQRLIDEIDEIQTNVVELYNETKKGIKKTKVVLKHGRGCLSKIYADMREIQSLLLNKGIDIEANIPQDEEDDEKENEGIISEDEEDDEKENEGVISEDAQDDKKENENKACVSDSDCSPSVLMVRNYLRKLNVHIDDIVTPYLPLSKRTKYFLPEHKD